jgi:hypothetical protein
LADAARPRQRVFGPYERREIVNAAVVHSDENVPALNRNEQVASSLSMTKNCRSARRERIKSELVNQNLVGSGKRAGNRRLRYPDQFA